MNITSKQDKPCFQPVAITITLTSPVEVAILRSMCLLDITIPELVRDEYISDGTKGGVSAMTFTDNLLQGIAEELRKLEV